MTRKRVAVLAAALGAVLVISANVLSSVAQQPPPPIATEFLSGRAMFTDQVDAKFKIKLDGQNTTVVKVDDPSRTVTARFTVQPGAQFPWHSHPGPVIVNVVAASSSTSARTTACSASYPAGTSFVDPGQGHVHTAFNPTSEPTVLMATLLQAPEAGPLLIPAPAPEDCQV